MLEIIIELLALLPTSTSSFMSALADDKEKYILQYETQIKPHLKDFFIEPINLDGNRKDQGKGLFSIRNQLLKLIKNKKPKENKNMREICNQCNGTTRCRYCIGTGKKGFRGYGKISTEPCHYCNGTGLCRNCKGRR